MSRKGALATSIHLIESMPRTINQTFTAQKIMKQRNSPAEMPSTGRGCRAAGSNPRITAAVA